MLSEQTNLTIAVMPWTPAVTSKGAIWHKETIVRKFSEQLPAGVALAEVYKVEKVSKEAYEGEDYIRLVSLVPAKDVEEEVVYLDGMMLCGTFFNEQGILIKSLSGKPVRYIKNILTGMEVFGPITRTTAGITTKLTSKYA